MELIKVFSREYSVQYAEIFIRLCNSGTEPQPMPLKTGVYIPDQGNEVFCIESEEFKVFTNLLRNKYSDYSALEKFTELFHHFGRAYVTQGEALSALGIEDIGATKLITEYRSYFDTWILYSNYLWVAFLLNDFLADKGKVVLEKKALNENQKVDITRTLFSPTEKTGILKLQYELEKLKKNGAPTLPESTLLEILHEYAWISCVDVQNDPWTQRDVSLFYEQLSTTPEPTLSFYEACSLAKLSSDEQELFEQIRKFASIKDMRDFYRRKGVYVALPFYDSLAQRLQSSRKDLAYLTKDEIQMAIQGNSLPSSEEITKRKNGFLMRSEKGTVTVVTDTAIVAHYKRLLLEESAGISELYGVSAAHGIVRGKVKIVLGVQDIPFVENGDILVAIATHPDYIPAMQRASAFVTDEGGITSHAAIVSREMKKPCIVGTKIATKVLHDGDMVEVDAEKGIVTILKDARK